MTAILFGFRMVQIIQKPNFQNGCSKLGCFINKEEIFIYIKWPRLAGTFSKLPQNACLKVPLTHIISCLISIQKDFDSLGFWIKRYKRWAVLEEKPFYWFCLCLDHTKRDAVTTWMPNTWNIFRYALSFSIKMAKVAILLFFHSKTDPVFRFHYNTGHFKPGIQMLFKICTIP